MIDNWLVTELLAEQRTSERAELLEEIRRSRELEPERRRPGVRRRLARALVGLGLRLDAEASRSALVGGTSRS